MTLIINWPFFSFCEFELIENLVEPRINLPFHRRPANTDDPNGISHIPKKSIYKTRFWIILISTDLWGRVLRNSRVHAVVLLSRSRRTSQRRSESDID